MTAHTPGPWVARRVDPQRWTIDAPDGDKRIGYRAWEMLAIAYGSDETPDLGAAVVEANARLIAAAPELLAFAQWIAARAHDDAAEGKRARAVIAAAVGHNTALSGPQPTE